MKKLIKVKTYRNLKNACKTLGFDVELPSRYKPKHIRVIADSILEIEFASIIVRKTKYSANYLKDLVIDGKCMNECNGISFSQYEGQNGSQYWNGSAQKPKAFLAIWVYQDSSKDKYAYSVYAPKGTKIKTMAKWEAKFK